MPIVKINTTINQAAETNVNWVENGEEASSLVLNRPIKDVSVVVNTVIDTVNGLTVSTIAALRLLTPMQNGQRFKVTSYYEGWAATVRGPIGGGEFVYDNSDNSSLDNGGSIIKTATDERLKRIITDYVRFSEFGVIGDNSTNYTSQAQSAINYAQTIKLPVKTGDGIFILDGLEMKAGVDIHGNGSSGYASNTTNSFTVLKRAPGAATSLIWNEDSSGLFDLDVDGNGGRLLASGDGITLNGSNYGHLERVKVIDCNYGIAGDTGTPPGSFTFVNVTVRQNNQGIRAFRDTSWYGCIVSANYIRGMYINQGQNKFLNGWVEFQRDQENQTNGVDNSAEGIYLDGNTSEFMIDGTHFDRNAGNSIFIQDGAQRITIGPTNQFKGCAWGGDMTDNQRYSIRVNGAADVLNLSEGILLENRNQGPSTEVGPFCPLGLADLGESTRVVVGKTNHADCANGMSLNSKDLVWLPSASGNSEYYLTLEDGFNVSPIIQPEFVSEGYSSLISGTVGSLASGEWVWADNDTLGQSTVYVRMSGDTNPTTEDVRSLYSLDAVDISGCVDVQTSDSLDSLELERINATTESFFTLKTRDVIGSGQTVKKYSLTLTGDQQSTAKNFSYELSFILRRDSSGAVSVIEGIVSEYISGETTATVGWSTTGSDDILVTLTASVLGDEVLVAINNTDATRFVDTKIVLSKN
jgi:hypothetical protein